MKTAAIIISIFLPGAGSLLMGKIVAGLIQLALAFTALLLNLTGIGILIGGPIGFVAWVWGLVTVARAEPKAPAGSAA
ncbi:hypothetical protein [Tepidicaulis sp.]|jgi:TM2 domain-containing membrane protein YozV|uniref:hypothetical protein n=1 Tax=Tepidicaulis sp. TaxID=1920809 RepID=UPI003B5B951C